MKLIIRKLALFAVAVSAALFVAAFVGASKKNQ